MPSPNVSSLRQQLKHIVGPSPWYWKTFQPFRSRSGQAFVWTYHGDEGSLAYLVSLALEQEPQKPRMVLNTYCRPFFVDPFYLGVWCPEGRATRIMCFDPDELKGFDFAEIAGWFKGSPDRVYAATAPVNEFELPQLAAGTHKIEVPGEFQNVEELIIPGSYRAEGVNDAAFALNLVYPHAGLVEVLPQQWFTAAQYEVGRHWITRAGRDPETHRLFGDCYPSGAFVLQEDGKRLESWMEKRD